MRRSMFATTEYLHQPVAFRRKTASLTIADTRTGWCPLNGAPLVVVRKGPWRFPPTVAIRRCPFSCAFRAGGAGDSSTL